MSACLAGSRRRGAEVWATRLGWTLARMLQLDHQEVPPPEQIAFRRRAGMPAELLEKFAARAALQLLDRARRRSRSATGRSATARCCASAGATGRVHFGHGHAPDHATLWTEDEPGGLVLAGDQIIPGISSNIGVYPSEPEADPLAEWLESCARLRRLAEGRDPLVLPGHKLPFRGAAFRLTQLIENHEGALDRILARLRQGRAQAAELFEPIFKREIGGSQYGLALAEAVAHMNHLL